MHLELRRNPDIEIALCAPTGKAQARLLEALVRDSGRFVLPDETRVALSGIKGFTIHRLLGLSGGGAAVRKDFLNYDLIVVDESSMISLELTAMLLQGMRRGTRLVLLGDHRQLASVESGTVFSDICTAAFSSKPENVLHGCVSVLNHNFRAESAPHIIELSEAIRSGGALTSVPLEPFPGRRELPGVLNRIIGDWRKLPLLAEDGSASSLEEAFGIIESFRIIAAVREGMRGVLNLNRAVIELLGLKYDSPGVPVTVLRNDYSRNLYNGDTGIIWKNASGDPVLRFPGRSAEFGIGLLGDCEPCFAMTAHKSQGSGFDRVLLVLPESGIPVLTRELVYTAITRARNDLKIWGNPEVFEYAIDNPTGRCSGLSDRLLT